MSGSGILAAGSLSSVTASYWTHEPSVQVRTISLVPFLNIVAGRRDLDLVRLAGLRGW